MRSILAQLAEGNLLLEPHFFEPASQYWRTMETLSESENKLLEVLKGEEYRLFKIFSEAQAEINRLSGIDQFVYGYRLGALMTTEVFVGTEGLTDMEEKIADKEKSTDE